MSWMLQNLQHSVIYLKNRITGNLWGCYVYVTNVCWSVVLYVTKRGNTVSGNEYYMEVFWVGIAMSTFSENVTTLRITGFLNFVDYLEFWILETTKLRKLDMFSSSGGGRDPRDYVSSSPPLVGRGKQTQFPKSFVFWLLKIPGDGKSRNPVILSFLHNR
jgi:hypothetical protein